MENYKGPEKIVPTSERVLVLIFYVMLLAIPYMLWQNHSLKNEIEDRDATIKNEIKDRDATISVCQHELEVEKNKFNLFVASSCKANTLTSTTNTTSNSSNGSNGVVRCDVEHRGGLTQKIIVYSLEGKTYAINGSAKNVMASRGWEDGRSRFSASQAQELLQEGLTKCNAGASSITPPLLSEIDVQKKEMLSQVNSSSTQPMTAEALTKAVRAGDIETTKRYIAAGFDVNKRIDYMGASYSAIGTAAAGGQCEILKLLLDAGGNPDPKNIKFGFTPLSYASINGSAPCVKLLLSRSVRLDVRTEPGGDTALIIAAYQGNIDVVRLLVGAGASLTISNKDNDTPYRAANVFSKNDVANFIKSKGGR